jgi:RNA polymerase sigma-70 factor (family 1)
VETCAVFLILRCSIKDSLKNVQVYQVQRNNHHTVADYIHSFQAGEEKGFSFLFREYNAALSYFSFHIIKDRGVAEEIAGDALMKLWERHENFDSILSIKSFLYTTTRNASIDWLRKQKRNNQRTNEIIYLNENKEEATIFQKKAEAELYKEIFLTLNTLPPKCRKIFRMLYIEGKNYQQIAQELNLSVDTIRNQKARGIILIKQRMVFCLVISFLLTLFV